MNDNRAWLWFLQRFERDDDSSLDSLVEDYGLDVMVCGHSLITAAVGKGAIKCLRKLIDLGASLHPKKGWEPVDKAMLSKRKDCLVLLIEEGAFFPFYLALTAEK